MVWAIRTGGNPEYLSFATVNRNDASWRIVFRLKSGQISNSSLQGVMGQIANLNDYISYRWNNVTDQDSIRYRVDNINAEGVFSTATTDDGDFHTYVIEDDGTDLILSIDGGTPDTVIGGGGKAFKDFNSFFRAANNYYIADLEYFRYYDTTGVEEKVHDWDATLSDHNSTTLTDFGTAANHATFEGTMSTSSWIDLGGGVVSVTDTSNNSNSNTSVDEVLLTGAFNVNDEVSNTSSLSNVDSIQFLSSVIISDSVNNSQSESNIDSVLLNGAFNILDSTDNTLSISNNDSISFSSAIIISDGLTNSNSTSNLDGVLYVGQVAVNDNDNNSKSLSTVDNIVFASAVNINDISNDTRSLSLFDAIQLGEFSFNVNVKTNINGVYFSTNINGVYYSTNIDG